ncbi:hypothetical protein ABE099_02380 [Paenibacillus turicensis]|uniref:hypothetical protein n=1 Tax=Paenibacillus turicensis TaxID=160487 RepID=UPI003D2735E2
MTNWAILFVCIFIPFFLILDFHTSQAKVAETLNREYTFALRTAVQDAGIALSSNEMQQYESSYESFKYVKANKDMAIDAFFRTLYLSFDVTHNRVGQGALASYVPAILVLDYDGYYIYAVTEYRDAQGQLNYKHMWGPKKPYAFADEQGNSINFTLDDYLFAYDATSKKWVKGLLKDIKDTTNIALLKNSSNFETQRRSTIVKSIQKDLAYYINKHNEYNTHYGVHYNFKLPLIPEEEWVNTINDVGIFAFIQGIPVGDQIYNNYAFGGGRLVKKSSIHGGVDPATGYKYYYQSRCTVPYQPVEIFDHKKDAAKAGYFPAECVKP